MRAITALVLSTLLLASCAVGPNYKRPAVKTPAQYRQPTATGAADKQSLAAEKWADLFQDQVITDLVKTALSQSHDLEAATQRVLQARAQ